MKQLIWINLKYQMKNYKLVMVQLIIGFLALLCGFSFLFGIMKKINSIDRLADKNTYHIFSKSGRSVENTEESIQQLSELYSKLEKEEGISHLQIFRVDSISYGKGNKLDIAGLNEDMINTIRFHVKKGSVEKLKQYAVESKDGYLEKSKVVPALVSEKYKNQYPLGMQVQAAFRDANKNSHTYTFEIVGLVDADMPMWRGNSTDTINNLEMTNPKLIVPLFREIDVSYPYILNVLFRLDNEKEADITCEKIKAMYQECGIDVSIQNVFEEADTYFKEQNILWLYSFGLAFVLLFLTELGNIGITLSLIQKRKREYGTYIALGMNMQDIKFINYMGMLIQLAASFLISIILYILIFEHLINDYPYPLSASTIISAFGLAMVINFIVQWFPMNQIKKLAPIELLDAGE